MSCTHTHVDAIYEKQKNLKCNCLKWQFKTAYLQTQVSFRNGSYSNAKMFKVNKKDFNFSSGPFNQILPSELLAK